MQTQTAAPEVSDPGEAGEDATGGSGGHKAAGASPEGAAAGGVDPQGKICNSRNNLSRQNGR